VSSVDDNEVKSLQDRFPRHMDKIEMLRKMRVQIKMGSKNQAFFDYPMGNKKREKMYHRYHAKHPFLPYFYFNGNSGRIIVSPLRTWIDKICPICDVHTEEYKVEASQNFEEFKIEFEEKFGTTQNIKKQILRATLLKYGINCFNKNVGQGIRFVEDFLSVSKMNPSDFIKLYDLGEDTFGKGPRGRPKRMTEVNPLKEKDDT